MSKILLIDDDAALLELLKERLTTQSYQVLTAQDGTEGLRQARVNRPDLIILDIAMPQMDGYSFIQSLKAEGDLRDIPIIVLTARQGMEDLFKIEGVRDYMVKPFVAGDLIKKIQKILAITQRSH